MGLKFARIATAAAATLLVVGGVASPASGPCSVRNIDLRAPEEEDA